jgi:hypothetical protein
VLVSLLTHLPSISAAYSPVVIVFVIVSSNLSLSMKLIYWAKTDRVKVKTEALFNAGKAYGLDANMEKKKNRYCLTRM